MGKTITITSEDDKRIEAAKAAIIAEGYDDEPSIVCQSLKSFKEDFEFHDFKTGATITVGNNIFDDCLQNWYHVYASKAYFVFEEKDYVAITDQTGSDFWTILEKNYYESIS